MSQQGTTPSSYPLTALVQPRAEKSSADVPKRDATLIERISGNNSRHQTYSESKDDIPFPVPSASTNNPRGKPSPNPSPSASSPSLNPSPHPAPRDTDSSPTFASWRSFLNIYDNDTSPPLTPVPTSSPVLFPPSTSPSSSAAAAYGMLSIPALGRRLTDAKAGEAEEGYSECLGAQRQRGGWGMPAMRVKDEEEERKEGEGGEDDTPGEEKDDPFSCVRLERGGLGSLGVEGEGYEDYERDDGEEPRQPGSGCGSGSGFGSESEEAESEAEYENEEDNDGKDSDKDESKEEEEDDDTEELYNFAPRRPPLTPKVSSFNHTNRYRFFGHINCPAFPRPPPASPRKIKTVMVPGRTMPERAYSVPTMPGGYGARVPSKLSGCVVGGGEPDRPHPFPQPTPHPPPGPRRSNTFSTAPCYNGLKQGHGARTQIIQNKADDQTGLAFGMLKVVEQRREWAPVRQPERWVLRGEFRAGGLKELDGHDHGQHGQHGHGGQHHHHHHGKKLVEGQS
ncbi:hypothetical protein I350_06675 [Cryptococcus amylolentus CBS 6273]|uniref:Uncharacterized protein n=1 Tax=Cryptococcus amylolentus CBS 6273 TaxID=1296118 RepID=A0A1E3JGN5_9TREE|nr:hypothetical protein I350_06675 [Cryptococcus amylolentus CBS 6273]